MATLRVAVLCPTKLGAPSAQVGCGAALKIAYCSSASHGPVWAERALGVVGTGIRVRVLADLLGAVSSFGHALAEDAVAGAPGACALGTKGRLELAAVEA